MYGFRPLGPNALLVKERVIRAESIENGAEVDIDEHMVVADLVFGRLEEVWVVLDVLDNGEESFEFAIFGAFCGPSGGRRRYVLDQLRGERRGWRLGLGVWPRQLTWSCRMQAPVGSRGHDGRRFISKELPREGMRGKSKGIVRYIRRSQGTETRVWWPITRDVGIFVVVAGFRLRHWRVWLNAKPRDSELAHVINAFRAPLSSPPRLSKKCKGLSSRVDRSYPITFLLSL